MLIVMAGLPGTGKSTIAGELARALSCAILSVDPIEAALWRAGIEKSQPSGLAAYVVAEELARQQLVLGHDVLIDAVNDAKEARFQWSSLAAELGTSLAFVEVCCSDAVTHQNRLQSRRRGIVGFPEPTWESVIARQEGFQSWSDARARLDSMRPIRENVAKAISFIENVRRP